MPVNSTHLDYDAALPAWLRARDVFAGEDAIKAAGERYLPKLAEQSQVDYDAYRTRGSFFNATARTVEGFIGLIFRRERADDFGRRGGGGGRLVPSPSAWPLAGFCGREQERRG